MQVEYPSFVGQGARVSNVNTAHQTRTVGGCSCSERNKLFPFQNRRKLKALILWSWNELAPLGAPNSMLPLLCV